MVLRGLVSVVLMTTIVFGSAASASAVISTLGVNMRATVQNTANAQLDVPYHWAGYGPGTCPGYNKGDSGSDATPADGWDHDNCFDCSGLTKYSYNKVGIYLPHYSASQYWDYCTGITADKLVPGDLIFRSGTKGIHHVAMYVGKTYSSTPQLIEAPYTGARVRRVTFNASEWDYFGRNPDLPLPDYAGTIQINAPTTSAGKPVRMIGTIDFVANASDANGINYVQFAKIGPLNVANPSTTEIWYTQLKSAPYVWTLDTTGQRAGDYRLRAKLVDTLNNTTYAAKIATCTVPNQARFAGADRYDTAAKVSQQMFPTPLAGQTVVLVRGDVKTDAMCVVPLARYLNAPILYTLPTSLPGATSAEIKRLHPAKIVVIGGTPAISDAVVSAAVTAAASNPAIERLNGANRYDTARMMRDSMGKPSKVVLVSTDATADAMSIAAPAAANGYAILQVTLNTMPAETLAALSDGVTEVAVMGSTSAVSDAVYNQIPASVAKRRVSGPDRYQTNIAIEKDPAFAPTGKDVYLVKGEGLSPSWTDGFCSAVLAASGDDPLLIVPYYGLTDELASHIRYAGYTKYWLVGSSGATKGYSWWY
jgi:putative cell wall-binding protein